MDQERYLIDELCGLTGFSRRTVHYYVQNGLVDPPAGRGRGGYYSDSHVGQLARIRELQDQGYRLEAIRGLIARTGELAPPDVQAVESMSSPVQAAEPARKAVSDEASLLPVARRPEAPRDAWARFTVAPGVELHVSIEAEQRLGTAVGTALETLRSIIGREGGLNG
jgi:DNA-binding transcriptional MerR regulator